MCYGKDGEPLYMAVVRAALRLHSKALMQSGNFNRGHFSPPQIDAILHVSEEDKPKLMLPARNSWALRFN